MKIFVQKTLTGLKPLTDKDQKVLNKFAVNDIIEIDIKKSRNYLFHKKYFALLNLAFQNQDKYELFEDFRALMTMKSGYYREIETEKGIIYLPTSISFGSMDDSTFEELYNSTCDTICREVIPGITKEEIQNELLNFM